METKTKRTKRKQVGEGKEEKKVKKPRKQRQRKPKSDYKNDLYDPPLTDEKDREKDQEKPYLEALETNLTFEKDISSRFTMEEQGIPPPPISLPPPDAPSFSQAIIDKMKGLIKETPRWRLGEEKRDSCLLFRARFINQLLVASGEVMHDKTFIKEILPECSRGSDCVGTRITIDSNGWNEAPSKGPILRAIATPKEVEENIINGKPYNMEEKRLCILCHISKVESIIQLSKHTKRYISSSVRLNLFHVLSDKGEYQKVYLTNPSLTENYCLYGVIPILNLKLLRWQFCKKINRPRVNQNSMLNLEPNQLNDETFEFERPNFDSKPLNFQ